MASQCPVQLSLSQAPGRITKDCPQDMPEPTSPSAPRVADPPCPQCKIPMRLSFVEPLDEPGYERRLYDCLPCKQSLMLVVKLA